MTKDQRKTECRELVRARLSALDADTARAASAAACARARTRLASRGTQTVMLYAPMRGELDVEPLVRELLARRARVCVPRVCWDAGSLEPVPIADVDRDLVSDRGSLRRPLDDLPSISVHNLEVVVVPGVAFDVRGGRLGRAGGFYDRFLAGVSPTTLSLGMCFDEQVVERVPMEEHDVAVHALVTPTRIVECPRSTEDRG